MPRSQPQLRHSLILFLLAVAATALGQTIAQPPKTPTFDIASIRQNVDPHLGWRMQFTADGVTALDVTLQYALEEAYGLYDIERWSGGPDWLNSRRFNIEARFDPAQYPDITLEQRRAMLRQMLADRCRAAVHHEPKDFPLYALVLAKNGPRLGESKPENLNRTNIYGSACLIRQSGSDHLVMTGCTVREFATLLEGAARLDLNRNVIDQTGLADRYDFALNWSPQDQTLADRLKSTGPDVFTALEKQLGLRLKPAHGQLDTIVIDHIEMPSEN